ncbi:DEAD/DEAH box helicase [Stackebrandtia nassauensis]|uniref:SNF2-related protein n=1 Tax=Stackebrandtia nassauensis (strain DSM 44728 / CIP 108903 / NRRL B-16338 / NBRC 102104 / LLR-40K-21) TaxID=446470 RepID=D3PV87_STANL|nr:DEAD/DEAH box helicase [Stackebrandtia nassauensis]ADD41140.1 SNF2-related protein [Stackebrandtia nassauensis DSM 44728]
MVWWGGGSDLVEAVRKHGLPDGAPGRLRLAVPTQDGDGFTVDRFPVRLVPLTQAAPALAALRVDKHTSDSLRAWRAAAILALSQPDPGKLAELAEMMPAAAHALCRDEASLWPADTLVSAFAHATRATYMSEKDTARELRDAQEELAPDARVEATLRPYQRRGLAWLRAVAAHHRGALLADDMGLGKTLQTIALLAERTSNRPHLVVCPTSVVGNWTREIARFAPDLPVVLHHGPSRREVARFPDGAVVVTSYNLLLRDIDLLSILDWDVVVLDEAQQIKNQASQTAKAARILPAQARVALTGTPVENRLGELWSIMDFVNPGILGSYSRFQKRFASPIESRADARVTERLRGIVQPFLLRRLKSEVAADLPAKQESTVACTLTSEQAKLYSAAVERAMNDGLGSGFERHGRVLKLLTELKQICNHPAQFLRQEHPLTGRSGKLARATEMLAEAVAEGAQSLVFTQYRVMGELLATHLAAELGLEKVPFLHGGVSQPGRDAMVAEFQSGDDPPPILIVSLKAGGTGLNLTAATHVLHYDRWWNPAVEDQATDRAHRIGQTKPVTVYKLVTGGTLEERISDLLERKRSLAESIVGTGEDWITNMDDKQLRQLIELSDVAVTE